MRRTPSPPNHPAKLLILQHNREAGFGRPYSLPYFRRARSAYPAHSGDRTAPGTTASRPPERLIAFDGAHRLVRALPRMPGCGWRADQHESFERVLIRSAPRAWGRDRRGSVCRLRQSEAPRVRRGSRNINIPDENIETKLPARVGQPTVATVATLATVAGISPQLGQPTVATTATVATDCNPFNQRAQYEARTTRNMETLGEHGRHGHAALLDGLHQFGRAFVKHLAGALDRSMANSQH